MKSAESEPGLKMLTVKMDSNVSNVLKTFGLGPRNDGSNETIVIEW